MPTWKLDELLECREQCSLETDKLEIRKVQNIGQYRGQQCCLKGPNSLIITPRVFKGIQDEHTDAL